MLSSLLFTSFIQLSAGLIQPVTSSILKVDVDESVVYPGVTTGIQIRVEVKEGYHIQAHAVHDESLVPTTLELNHNENIIINKQDFPSVKKFSLEGTDTYLDVYDGRFLIKIFITPVTKAPLGKFVLQARLSYQACDSRSCLFPRFIDFQIPIEVKTIK